MSNKEVTIGIAGFTYIREVMDPITGNATGVATTATRGQTIEVNEIDYEKGTLHDAFVVAGAETDGEAINVVDLSDDELDDYLNEESPNVGETVALAAGDPESAQRILDAEERVTDGEPRQGVVDGLTKVTEG